ncbi:hypothetical protein GCM10022261_17090 [Brevibacterium daeguense]|uniref:histidine kinase n=2 Tax=Brevibacterium daeguense TaxID=909936 RepID=A0ABP8EJQ6_9MICO
MLVLLAVPGFMQTTAEGEPVGPFPAILLPSSLTFVVVLYSIAAHAQRPWPALALAIGLVGSVAVAAGVGLSPFWDAGEPAGIPEDSILRLLSRFAVLGLLVGLVLAAWALGRYRSVRMDYLAALRERAERAEADREQHAARVAAEERERIARDMHDVVAHSLAVIVRQADGGRMVGAREPTVALEALDTIGQTAREALEDTRGVLHRLRSDDEAAQVGADNVPDLVERMRASGVDVELTVLGEPVGLTGTASMAIYRVVQESLTNVVKHAGPEARAAVTVEYRDDGVDVTIRNGGSRASTSPAVCELEKGGHGLLGMRERVTLEGGELSAGPTAEGYEVRAWLPATSGRNEVS